MASASPKVVVVGGGIAGLTAAYHLHQAGIDVELYEARQRSGGRIFSVDVDGYVGELGGQNLLDGGDAVNVRRLIDEFGLEVLEKNENFNIRYYENDQLVIDELNSNPVELRAKLDQLAQNSQNMEQVLDQLFDRHDPQYRFLDMILEGYEGGPASKLSPLYIETLYHLLMGGLSAAHQVDEEGAYQALGVKQGNSLLTQKLADSLGDRIHYNCALTSVGRSALHFKNGEKVVADIVVLAIPCSVYEDITFEESVISEERLSAIQNVQYSRAGKILVPVGQVSWLGMAMQDYAGAFFNIDGHLLNLYLIGKLGSFSEENLQRVYDHNKHVIEIAYGDSVLPMQQPVMARDELFASYQGPVGHSWLSDPYAKGAYSYIAAGQAEILTATQTVGSEVVKTLFAPIDGRLFFAGEHASILFEVPGTIEAACESGERTARMVIDHCSKGLKS